MAPGRAAFARFLSMKPTLLVVSLSLLFALARPTQAGPLSLLIPDDARAFGFDERLSNRSTSRLEPNLLTAHPSALPGIESLPLTVDLSGHREFTFRRTRIQPSEVTRVASQGVRLGAMGTLGSSKWRFAFTGAPSERELYNQSRSDASANGNFDTFVLGFGRRLSARETLGVSVSHQRVELPLDVDTINLGELLPNVSRFDGDFKETRVGIEWERATSPSDRLRLRAGLLSTDAGLDVQSSVSNRAAQVNLSTTGFDLGFRLLRTSSTGKEWALEASAERRSDTAPLLLDDGTPLGTGSGSLKQGNVSLYRRGTTKHGAWSLGLEHFGGRGNLAVGADLGPFFPSNPLGGLGRVNANLDVKWRATLARAGRVQQVTKRVQLRSALAFGEVLASYKVRGRAFVLLPIIGQSISYDGSLGPRLGLIPSVGASYKVGCTMVSAQISQFIPLPEGGDDTPSPPPPPGTTRARSFGGTLASIALQLQF